jgi:hypothetical protein
LNRSPFSLEIFSNLKVKVKVKVKTKFILEQAMKTQSGSRCIVILFLNLGARKGWVVNVTSRPLYPLKRPGTHCTGGGVGPRAVLDGCGKSHLYRKSIPGPSSP